MFAAKVTLLDLIGTAISAIMMLGMFMVSQPIYSANGLETASPTDSDAIRFLLVGDLFQRPLYILLSFAIAWMPRGTASSVTVPIGFFFPLGCLRRRCPTWCERT